MEKLKELLEAHINYYSGDECSCGAEFYGFEKQTYEGHLAEMLKPLLAATYATAFSDGYDLAADDIGAWQCNLDLCVDSGDNADGYTNPYTKETN